MPKTSHNKSAIHTEDKSFLTSNFHSPVVDKKAAVKSNHFQTVSYIVSTPNSMDQLSCNPLPTFLVTLKNEVHAVSLTFYSHITYLMPKHIG